MVSEIAMISYWKRFLSLSIPNLSESPCIFQVRQVIGSGCNCIFSSNVLLGFQDFNDFPSQELFRIPSVMNAIIRLVLGGVNEMKAVGDLA